MLILKKKKDGKPFLLEVVFRFRFFFLFLIDLFLDTKLEEAAELLEYGGAIDQQLAMTKLDTYLRLEMIGIKVMFLRNKPQLRKGSPTVLFDSFSYSVLGLI